MLAAAAPSLLEKGVELNHKTLTYGFEAFMIISRTLGIDDSFLSC